MLKKVIISILVLSLILGICLNVNAAELKTKLEVTKQASETKNLENNKGYISKTIVDSDAEKGEVTIEVKINNGPETANETLKYENTEIYIIVSLGKNESYEYIGRLAEKLINYSSNVKIGIIGIMGPIADFEMDENDNEVLGTNDESFVKGTDSNAKVVIEATNNLEEIRNSISNINPNNKSYYRNLQAALNLVKNSFSNNANKIVINCFTTVPAVANGETNGWNYGGSTGYATSQEALEAKLDNVVSKTKSAILELKNNDIEFISIRPKDTDFTVKAYNAQTGEFKYQVDGEPYANELYGTIENPVYGKMYAMDEDNLDRIITEYMYQDVINTIGSSITNTKIVDYFPKDVTDNFEFSYVGTPSVGTVSDEIDKTTNTITWNIGTLDANKVATLKYKLKIKDMKNKDLLEKEIATNEKIILTYKDVESNDYTVNLSSSPKIKLTEVKETEASKKDETTAQNKIPQTGVSMTIVGAIVIVIGVSGFTFIMFRKYKEIK